MLNEVTPIIEASFHRILTLCCIPFKVLCVFSHLSLKTSLWCKYYYYLHLTDKEIESLGGWTVTQGHQHLLKTSVCRPVSLPTDAERDASTLIQRGQKRSPKRNYPAQMSAVQALGSKASGLLWTHSQPLSLLALGSSFSFLHCPQVGQRSVLESGCHWLCDLGQDTWVGRWQYCGSIRRSINTGFLAKWLDIDHLT